ncbi:MAG: hypothetical protein HOD92_23475 [Deltaproteobacteria bacterium]|jgi:hypothetical protein|nr:hypothetical protein [Deltaproteobacteria bacterium]
MVRKVINLTISFAICLGFMFYVGPWVDTFESVKPLIDFIEERDIDAGALYYTEIEEFSEANINMENTMDYTPGKNF